MASQTTPQQDRRPVPTYQRRPTPLTHHDIMRLVAPFTARGLRVDLKRSDRERRRLLFVPAQQPAPSRDAPLRVTLQLEVPLGGRYRLTREVAHEAGLEATMVAEGRQLAPLLEAMDRLPPQRQILRLGEVDVTHSYRVDLDGEGDGGARSVLLPWQRPPRRTGAPLPTLVRACAVTTAFTLTLSREERSIVHPLTLEWRDEDLAGARLPQDLFCVLGRRWRPLRPRGRTWCAGFRPPPWEPERSGAVRAALRQATEHLQAVLAAAPEHFHERFAGARRAVFLRRLLPLSITLAGAAAIVTTAVVMPKTALMHMTLSQVPFALILLFSLLREPPRIELPPFPRRPSPRTWSWRASGPP